jgi:hypothetical protein
MIPDFLSHLPQYAGFPVPVIMLWVDGKPDFRAIDTERALDCYNRKLCGVCGRPLRAMSYFIGGDGCKRSHFFLDPAMHFKCAEFSANICPFISGKREGYSERAIPDSIPVAVRPAFVPEKMYIMRSMTKWTRMRPAQGGGVAFRAGTWLECREVQQSA